MTCPGCGSEMERLRLDGTLGNTIEIDVCNGCRAFWFDPFETLQFAPSSTLELFRLIASAGSGTVSPLPAGLECPRCDSRLKLSHDRQRNTPFEYWSCPHGHGRFTRFNDFLKEKNFIQPLTPQQIRELRRNVQMINCSNCGAAVDLVKQSACAHCGSPLVMLDRKAMAALASQYHDPTEKKRPAPPLPSRHFPDTTASLLDLDLLDLGHWLMDLLRVLR
jgi:DNA-directed RNA polymerase subunit RPC12/RpoP